MTRRSAVAAAIAVGLVSLPIAAAASEGGLVIFPEIIQNLLYGDGELWKTPWRAQEVQLLAFFAVLVWPANRFVFAPLIHVLDQRKERIEGARARAKTIDGEAERVLGEYQLAVTSARKLAEQDRRGRMEEARREQSRVTTEARGVAEAEMQRARAGVAEALGRAREELRSQAEELAREAASRVLGRSLS